MSLDIRPNPSASAGGITGGLVYKGSYNATTNSPDLTSSDKGDFYIVSVGGTLAGVTLDVGDHIVFNQDAASPINSAMFDKIDNTDAVASVNGQTGVVSLDTDNISEGSNLYYTNARFDTQLGTKDTGDLSEGSNLYYTNARADARIGAANLTDLNDVNYSAGAGINGYVLEYVHANTRWEAKVPATAPVSSVNTQTGAVVLDSDDVAEGTTNLYYTNARFDTQLATKNTGDLAEGSNLYYTNARFDTQLATKDTDDLSEGTTNLYYTNARFDTQLGTKDTGDLAEGSNLYYTNARSDARIGAADLTDLNDVNYTAGAGIDNYVLTYNHANTRWEAEVPATAPVSSVNTQTGAVVLDSDDIAEGTTNLYYTNARFDSRFDTQLGTKDTGDLAEGSNLYYTNARFDTQLGTKDTDNLSEGTSNLYYTNARFDTQLGTKDTGDLAEGSNLYYTNARADARIAAANLTDLNDVSYTAGAGIDNYVLTYNHANTRWEAEAAAGGGGSAPDTTTVSQGTDYTISTSTGIEEAFFITPSADINVNLPSAVTVGEGYKYNIKNLASGFSLTVDANGSQTIDASLTYVINNQFQSITIMSDGANWFII